MYYMRISSVGGLYHEFYKPVQDKLSVTNLEFHENELDATNLFWSLIFDIDNIKKIIDKIIPYSPQYIAIKGNASIFIKQIELAKSNICNPNISEKEFYCYLETLSIVCKIYSEYVFNPFRLTIQNGFEIDNSSAEQLYKNCLDSAQNPYLEFIKLYVWPKIQEVSPKIIFMDGMPTIYTMAICRLIKNEFPQVHISISRHSSEYYSLNKLESYLIHNKYLFKMVDSVVLEYFDETEKQLLFTLKHNHKLDSVVNLLYKYNDKVYKTSYKAENNDYTPVIEKQNPISKLINIHLQPYAMCYWNKCTFCGINKKYHFNNESAVQDALKISLNKLKETIPDKIKYIWFIDEAIHPEKLKYVAKYFIENKIHVLWQARCRIEKLLLDQELITLLQQSGLKELRLGLESASYEVLKAMHKFDDDFSLETVDKICDAYSARGISIHFPMIIGFPGESSFERKKTYNYLQYLCKKYPLVSFNINVFNLDIKSYVFSHHDEYEIEKILHPCPLQDFLGNILKWERKEDMEQQLFRERDQFMRETLYPWMPANSFIKPHIFYRLSETIRNTLIWKCRDDNNRSESSLSFNRQTKIIVPDTLVYNFDSARNIYIIYNWQTHHYMIGNKHLIFVLDFFQNASTLSNAVNYLTTYDPAIYISDDLNVLLLKLYQKGYLIELKRKGV